MKRSEMVQRIATRFKCSLEEADDILKLDEELGLCPPATQVKNTLPKDTRWGVLCTMRCNCEECNPDFMVHRWDLE